MTNSEKNSVLSSYKLPLILLAGIAIGSMIGAFAPDFARKLAPFGDIFINLMFTAVVPLVFLSVSSAVSSMVDLKRLGKILSRLILVFVTTGVIASIIILFVVKIFPPAEGVKIVMEAGELEQISLGQAAV